jgi:Arc/MetJ-type ribon-helix-helix transcriptional regulator
MKTISLKLENAFLNTIERIMKKSNYTTKTEFIREAIRDKMEKMREEKKNKRSETARKKLEEKKKKEEERLKAKEEKLKEKEKKQKEKEEKVKEKAEETKQRNPFKLTEKTFDEIKNTKNPKLEYKKLLKSYFNELTLTSYGQLPGDFVQAVNNVKVYQGKPNKLQTDALQGVIDFYRMNLSKKPELTETKIKVKKATQPTTKSVKNPRSKSVKAPRKKAVVLVKRKITKPRKPNVKKSKSRMSKLRGKGKEQEPISKEKKAEIEKEIRLII